MHIILLMGIHQPTGLLHSLEPPTTYDELRQVMTIVMGSHIDRLARFFIASTVEGFREREKALMQSFAHKGNGELPPDVQTGAKLYLLDLDLLYPGDEPSALRFFLQRYYRSATNEDDPDGLCHAHTALQSESLKQAS